MPEKPRISEMDIAREFALFVLRTVKESWPRISNFLHDFFPNDPTVVDGESAAPEFALAVVSYQIQALPNLFPSDQAARIRSHVVRFLCFDEVGTYPAEAIEEYQAAWNRSLQMAEPPHLGVAAVLFGRLVGVEVSDPLTIDPLVLTALGGEIALCGGPLWKAAASAYTIEPSSGEDTPGSG